MLRANNLQTDDRSKGKKVIYRSAAAPKRYISHRKEGESKCIKAPITTPIVIEKIIPAPTPLLTFDNPAELAAADDSASESEDYDGHALTEIESTIFQASLTFEEFLNNPKIINGRDDPTTNIVNRSSTQCYNVPNQLIPEFFKLMNNTKNMPMIYEKQLEYSGVMVDFDIIQVGCARQVNEKQIKKCCMNVLQKCMLIHDIGAVHHIGITMKERPVPYLLKDIDSFKDGFHLLLPSVMTTRAVKRFIMAEMAKDMRKIFSAIDIGQNEYENIVDPNSSHVGVHFIDSPTKIAHPAYKLQYVYRANINSHNEIKLKSLNLKKMDDVNWKYEMSLNWMASGGLIIKQKYPIKPGAIDMVGATNKSIDRQDVAPSDYKPFTFEQVKLILSGLNVDRFADYGPWCKVIWIISRWQFANNQDEKETLQMLDEFCSKCKGYGGPGPIHTKFYAASRCNSDQVSFGTLVQWLKIDSPNISAVLYKPVIKEIPTHLIKNYFDKDDPFMWNDLVTKYKRVFSSLEELANLLNADLARVMVRITDGEGCFIKRDSADKIYMIPALKGTGADLSLQYFEQVEDRRCKKETFKSKLITNRLSVLMHEQIIIVQHFARSDCYPNPDLCPENEFNIWTGFAAKLVEIVDMEKIKYVLDVLRIWSNKDEKLYKYLLAWFRYSVAHPEKMIGVALFLYSNEGTGKNFIINFFSKFIFGLSKSVVYAGVEQIIRPQEVGYEAKKLIIINEMTSGGGTADNFKQLNPFITDEVRHIDPKNRDQRDIKLIANTICATNSEDGLFITPKARRFTCVQVSEERMGKIHEPYWIEAHKITYTQDTGDHFYTYLMQMNPDDLPSPRIIYETKLRLSIIKQCESAQMRFLNEEILQLFDETIALESDEESDEPAILAKTSWKAQELFDKYVIWAKNNNEIAGKSRKFFSDAATVLNKTRKNTGWYYSIKT